MREMFLIFSIARTSSEFIFFLIPSPVERHGETSSDLASRNMLSKHRVEAIISPGTIWMMPL